MLDQTKKYDYAIVGAGVHGLSAAYYLSKTSSNIAIFDRFTIGHSNGSSHGPSRITRSTYEYELFRDLNNLALNKNWPEMEKVLGTKLIYNNDFLFYDDNEETYRNYENVAKTSNGQLVVSSIEEIEKKYENVPPIKSKFPPIIDKKAAMIAADDYILKLS